jgi:voltage-gated potassium channel
MNKTKFTLKKYRIAIIFVVLAFFYIESIIGLVAVESAASYSNIKTVEDAVWFSVVTISGVGYGDKYPITLAGRLISSLFIIASAGLFAFLLGRIINYFNMLTEKNTLGLNGTKFENHFVIIGWDDFSQDIADKILESKRKVAIIVDDRDEVDLIYQNYSREEVFVLFADFDGWSLNLKDDTQKLVYILEFKKYFPHTKILVILENASLEDTFQAVGVKYALSRNDIVSKMVVSYVMGPDVAQFSEDLLTLDDKDLELDMKEFLIPKGHKYVNQTYNDCFFDLKKEMNAVLIGISKNIEGQRVLLKNPSNEVKIEPLDYLVVMVNRSEYPKVDEFFNS